MRNWLRRKNKKSPLSKNETDRSSILLVCNSSTGHLAAGFSAGCTTREATCSPGAYVRFPQKSPGGKVLPRRRAEQPSDQWKGHGGMGGFEDRKSTRLNSSHVKISYAVFCLKKK